MLKLLLEKSLEWDLSFWMASLNFRNAFDKIEHESLFRDLREQGMPGAYITLLARLYHNQTNRWCAQSCIFQRGFGGCYVIMEAKPHKSRRLTWSTRTFDKCNICWQPPFICNSHFSHGWNFVWRTRQRGMIADDNSTQLECQKNGQIECHVKCQIERYKMSQCILCSVSCFFKVS